ncbi:glycosyltransferase [Patescibacteria group bacterium]|nr:glycosyltransferase [Patescibacteria group bacterium]
MKRIAMLSFHTCPLASQEGKETGGMNVYVYELSKELVKIGYAIDAFTRCQEERCEEVVEVTPGFRVIHINAGPQASYPKKELMALLPEFVRNMEAFLSREQLEYDLFHAHYYLSGLAGMSLRERIHAPAIPMALTYHTLALMKNLVARDVMEQETPDRIEAEIRLSQTADAILVPSKNDRAYLEYLYGCPTDKLAIVTPGVNTALFHPIPKPEAKQHIHADLAHKIVLFVGRIEPLKGIDTLLYAMKIIRARHRDKEVCLFIVGGDVRQSPDLWTGELKKLERLRRSLDLETVVRFVGQKPQEELPYYYNAADVVTMPSHYESFGMSALEAMACGIPVLTTNVAGITNLWEKWEETLVASANNPLLLAGQMETLLFDENKHREMSEKVLEKTRKLTWHHTALQAQAVYEKLIHPEPGHAA